jgi:hypothetical protein
MDWTFFCSVGDGADGDKEGFGCFLFGSELCGLEIFIHIHDRCTECVQTGDVQFKQVIFDASCDVSEAVFDILDWIGRVGQRRISHQ